MKYIVNSLKDVEKNMYMTNKYNVAYIYIYIHEYINKYIYIYYIYTYIYLYSVNYIINFLKDVEKKQNMYMTTTYMTPPHPTSCA